MSLPQQTSRVPSYIFIGLLLLLPNMRLVSAAPIVLYEDVDFKGKSSRFQVGPESSCINLVGKLNDFHSSIDTLGDCILLCDHRNCRGKCQIVKGKLEDLSAIRLNDKVSSMRSCDVDLQPKKNSPSTPPPTGEEERTLSTIKSSQVPLRSSSARTKMNLKRRRRKPNIAVASIPDQPRDNLLGSQDQGKAAERQVVAKVIQQDQPNLAALTNLRSEPASTSTENTQQDHLHVERRNRSDNDFSVQGDGGVNSGSESEPSNTNTSIINSNTPRLLEKNPSWERIQQSVYRHLRKRRKLADNPKEKTS